MRPISFKRHRFPPEIRRCHITSWHSQDFAVNMPIKLQRSPLAMSSALRRETGEVSDGISSAVAADRPVYPRPNFEFEL